ncbi:MAG: tyrosine-type recombinase/integrase [Aestuariibacter sp.]|nr:tyrosine-type recombinase/integrase [Aestuariibacter sp.]
MNNLQTALNEYLRVRRTLGFKLRDEGTVLPQFLRFMEEKDSPFITTNLALEWATQPENVQPAHWARRLSMVRIFAQFRSALDPRTEIPPQGLLPYRYRRKAPYIYDDGEISRLIEAASHLRAATELRASTYSTLIGLLAITGMRISEPIALDSRDVDLTHGMLTVQRTKFRKSRLIPVHPSTVDKLMEYSLLKSRTFNRPKSPSFFVSERGARLTQWSVRYTFVKLSCEIGLRAPHDSHGPRLHDLRHTFAVKTLIRWYQTGVDVESHMPELATYLGHTHVNDTYWYISAVPELLRLATLRLDKNYGGKLS